MSDYTIIQQAKLKKYEIEFLDYITSVLEMARSFKKQLDTNYVSLTPEKQETKRDEYLKKVEFFEIKINDLETIIDSFKKIVKSIERLSQYTDQSIRVRTAINVVENQFTDSRISSSIRDTYNADFNRKQKDSSNIEAITNDITNLSLLLDKHGISSENLGKKTIAGLISALNNLALEMYRTHSVDFKLKNSFTPRPSLTTEEQLQVLDEYEKKVKTGQMNRIQVLNTRVLFAGARYTPSRIMITGEKSRAALVRISTLEKQIAAIDTAVGVIARGKGYMGYDNTYLLLVTLRFSLEESLKKQISEYSDDEIKTIGMAMGKHNDYILEYAKMYADLDHLIKTSPYNIEKISMMRTRLLHYSESKKMTTEEISQAIKMGRVISKDKDAVDGNIQLKIDLDNGIVSEISSSATLEDRVLFKLKEQGVMRSDASLYNLTPKERTILNKQLRLESEGENALDVFRQKKLSYDRNAVRYRQSRFSKKPVKR